MDNLLEYKLDLIADALGAYKIEDVATVVFRHYTRSDGEEAQLIDFYPPWSPSGGYGVYKVASEYMDEDWQRERFEKYAGVKIADLPSFEGQQAMQRRHGRPHRCEVEVGPFRLMVKPQKNDDGKDGKTLILRYLSSPEARRRPAQNQPTAQPASPARPQGQTAVPPTNPNPPQTAAPRPTANQATKVAVDWRQQAMQAVDPLDFDHSWGRVVGASSKEVEVLRVSICGQWQDGRSPAYVAAMEEYSRVLAESGKEAAIERAKNGYHIIADLMTEADRRSVLESADVETFAGRVWKLYPEHFDSAQKVSSLFTSLYAGLKFRGDHTQAYLDGMLACAKSYKSGLATNTDARTAYAAAKLKGMEAYHLTLDLGGRKPPPVNQPRLVAPADNTYSQ